MRPPSGRSPIIAMAASRSAVAVAVVVVASTTRPLRFSISTCPMWHNLEACPADLGTIPDHRDGSFALGRRGRGRGCRIHDQAVAVLHQHMSHVAQLGGLPG